MSKDNEGPFEYRGMRGERLNTVTVRELREALEFYDDNMLVIASCNYGDYSRTQQAICLGNPVEVRLVDSAYSQSGFAVDTKDDGSDEDICPECDGEKQVPDPSAEGQYITCDICDGKGTVEDERTLVLDLGGI